MPSKLTTIRKALYTLLTGATLLCLCPSIHAVEISGSWDELDAKLMAGDYAKLPKGTREFKVNYYCIVMQQTNWKAAKKWCEDRGGHLATITSAEENNHISVLIHESSQAHDSHYFIGATDSATEGQWKWTTDEVFKYKNWAANEPSKPEANEDYLTAYYKNSAVWNDAPNQHKLVKGFIIEWEGSNLNPKEKQILTDAHPDFPKTLLSTHKLMQRKLKELQVSGNEKSFNALVKSYGKKIVYEEKQLTKQRKIKQAKAVNAVKKELIALLKTSKKKQSPTKGLALNQSETKPAIHVLIDKGEGIKGMVIDSDKWKKKSDVLVSTGKNATITFSGKIVGKGDFLLYARIKMNRIGDTWPMMKIGDTEAGIDGSESKAWLQFGAFYRNEHKGERTAGVVQPDTYFDWTLERRKGEMTVSVNRKILIKRNIHNGPLGSISLRCHHGEMTLKSFVFEGRLIDEIKTKSVIASHEHPDHYYHSGQVIHLKKKDLICLYRGHIDDTRRIRIHYSKDNGDTWRDQKVIADSIKGEGEISSFSSIFDTQQKACHLLFTRGNSNQEIYSITGKNYARMWSKPTEITFTVKEQGWDVIFANSGLITKNGKKRGQMLIPYHAGGEIKDLYILHSDNGKDWKRLGPIVKKTSGIASIVEFSDGKLLLATGGVGQLRTSISTDGGFTWGKTVNSSMALNQHKGSMAVVNTADDREILLYSGSTNSRGDQTNNLCLWVSIDQGKTWKDLGVICYGPSYYSNIIARTPGNIGLFVRAYPHWNRAQQRYHRIKLESLRLP